MDIGMSLRMAREGQGKSLRDVAQATKISMLMLEAMEKNDFSRLPGGIFGRAFVRCCAQEVGLDPEPIIRELIERVPDAAPDPMDVDSHVASAASRGRRWLAVVGALVILAAAATGAYFWAASTPSGRNAPNIDRGSR
jgi:cytoskeleton protein RodZ